MPAESELGALGVCSSRSLQVSGWVWVQRDPWDQAVPLPHPPNLQGQGRAGWARRGRKGGREKGRSRVHLGTGTEGTGPSKQHPSIRGEPGSLWVRSSWDPYCLLDFMDLKRLSMC